jgi:DNA-binding NarL/FixJ family response regulator
MVPQPDDLIRVALVDDHVLVREGIREILQVETGLEVVGQAGDSASAVALVASCKPDIVLLDVEMPGDVVTTTVGRMMEVSPDTRVIILSMYDGARLVQDLVARGIKGYLLKSATRHELVAAIRSVGADGNRIILSVSRNSLTPVEAAGGSVLSPRECDVLQLVAEAKSNAQVASRLSMTEATVKRHLRNIFVKLDAVSRIDAVNKAVAASLIQIRK